MRLPRLAAPPVVATEHTGTGLGVQTRMGEGVLHPFPGCGGVEVVVEAGLSACRAIR